jgi:siroheme synthase
VTPDIIDFARREAKNMRVGGAAQAPSGEKDDTGALALALAKSGKRVTWLRHGNPGADTAIAACRAAGIAVEVVPGAG